LTQLIVWEDVLPFQYSFKYKTTGYNSRQTECHIHIRSYARNSLQHLSNCRDYWFTSQLPNRLA